MVFILEIMFNIVYFSIFLTGIIYSIKDVRNKKIAGKYAIIFYLIMLATMGPPLVTISSRRFSLPMLPFVYLFQAIGIAGIHSSIKRKFANFTATRSTIGADYKND